MTVTSSGLAGKAKETITASSDKVENNPFLSLLFDRQDYLLAVSDSENEGIADDDFEQTLDPRVLYEGEKGIAESLMDIYASHRLSLEKGEAMRSIHVTHLRSRQSIVNTIRIHPNLNLRNLFGNLPFSSSIRANNYPDEIQETQVNNLFLPTWAMMTVNTKEDPGSLRFAFSTIIQEATAMLESGSPQEFVIEAHSNIGALFDEAEFNQAGILSKWAAGMVHSVMLKGVCRTHKRTFVYAHRSQPLYCF